MNNFISLNNYLLFKNPLYHFILQRKSESGFIFNPKSLWEGNKQNGSRILNGYLNYQGESFPLDNFLRNNASESWRDYLNSFLWLKDLSTLRTNESRIFFRNFLDNWLDKNKYFNDISWKEQTVSKRMFSLLTHLSFYFDTANEDFQKRVARYIFIQTKFLFHTSRFRKKEIFTIKALILSSLCIKNLEKRFPILLEDFHKLLQEDILEDGMHYKRSPSQHFFFLCSMIDIRNFLSNAKKKIPSLLNDKIDEMVNVLKFFRIADGQLSIFNEHKHIDSVKIENVIKKGGRKIKKIPSILHSSGFHRVSKNKLTFLMDCGQPSNANTYAGSLSFEFSHQKNKIVVNCGSPFINNKKWHEAMRSTAAHSTLNLDEVNSSDIFFNRFNKTRKAQVWSEKYEENNLVWINSAHSGYRQIFGIVHNRKIHIDSLNLTIKGQDYLAKPIKRNHNIAKYFYILFHIHPEIELNVTSSKKKVVLKLKNNVGWEFICSEPILEIGEGIYLGDGVKKENNHILIRDSVIPNKKIKWMFRIIK